MLARSDESGGTLHRSDPVELATLVEDVVAGYESARVPVTFTAEHALTVRGVVKARQSDFSGAFTDFDAANRLDQRTANALYGRGLAQVRLGRADAGQADIAAANMRDPAVAARFAGWGLAP